MRGRIHKLSNGQYEVQLGGIRDRFYDILRSNRMIFVACGTSYHACLACRQVSDSVLVRFMQIVSGSFRLWKS